MLNFFVVSHNVHAGVISDAPRLSEVLLNILQFLLSLAAMVAIIALVIAGIRYMFIRNTESAASVKNSLIAIGLGLLVIMGALIVVSQIGRFLS